MAKSPKPGWKKLGPAALLVAVFAPGGSALAQKDGEVRYTVSVGFASAREGATHPEFRGIPGPFKSVSMQQERSYTLRLGERGRHTLPTGGEIRMLPEKVRGQRLHMRFEVPGVVDTRLRLRNGKRMVVGGVPFKDGHLIIQVRPEFPQRRAASEPIPVRAFDALR